MHPTRVVEPRVRSPFFKESAMIARLSCFPLVILLALTSCSNTELERKIDDVFEQSRSGAHDNGSRTPWEVGQWVTFRITNRGHETLFRWFGGAEKGFKTIAITKKKGTAFWLERHEIWPNEESHTAVLVDKFESAQPEIAEVLRVKMETDDGEVKEFPADDEENSEVATIRERVQSLLTMVGHAKLSSRARDVTVPAGTFEETHPAPISVNLRTGRAVGNIWYTNAVPIAYYAKSEVTTGSWMFFFSTVTEELVDFGSKGAQSHFFP